MNLKKQIKSKKRLLYNFLNEERWDARKRILNSWEEQHKPDSVILFTTHKCASMFMETLFTIISKGSEYKVVDYASIIYGLGDKVDIGSPYEDYLSANYYNLYKTKGEIYAPQRRALDFPGRTRFKHIFFLRDPRDVLVSAYYSFGYTHSTPTNTEHIAKFEKSRNKIKEQGIDDYALEQVETWIKPLYEDYQKLRESADNYLYLQYDLFKDNTTSFIQKIGNYLDIQIDDTTISKLIEIAQPTQTVENQSSHKRSGKSRQFVEKLTPETVGLLNEKLASVLAYWEFEV